MFDFSNYRWREKYPIAAPALLLSGFFVARTHGDETHIYRVSGEYLQQANRLDILEVRRHLQRNHNQMEVAKTSLPLVMDFPAGSTST